MQQHTQGRISVYINAVQCNKSPSASKIRTDFKTTNAILSFPSLDFTTNVNFYASTLCANASDAKI